MKNIIDRKAEIVFGFIVLAVFIALTWVTIQNIDTLQTAQNQKTIDEASIQETTKTTIDLTLPTETLFTEAQKLFTAGEYADTIAIYIEILTRDPENVNVHQQIAHTYRYWNKYEQSEEWFLKAIRLDPNNAFLHTDLGKLYRNMGEYEKAEAAFHDSLAINPNDDTTYSYGLGYLYFEKQEYEKSEEMFKKALEINPQSEIGHAGLADLYREMKRYEESEAMYKATFQLNLNSEAYLGLGWLYIQQGRFEEAIVPLEAFLKNIREKGEVYYTLGRAYEGSGRVEDARRAFIRAVELNPDNTNFTSALETFTQLHPL